MAAMEPSSWEYEYRQNVIESQCEPGGWDYWGVKARDSRDAEPATAANEEVRSTESPVNKQLVT